MKQIAELVQRNEELTAAVRLARLELAAAYGDQNAARELAQKRPSAAVDAKKETKHD
jgi:hypothetical protein